MKAYLMDGYIVCTTEPVTGASAEWELSGVEAELVNAGASVRYEEGKFIITPAPPIIEVPPETNVITKRAFLKRLTPEEFATIKGAASQNATVDYYWQMFMLSEEIDLLFEDTINGLNMMEQAGLLAAGRAAEILG